MNYSGIIAISIFVGGLIGWVANIVKIFSSGPIAEWTGIMVGRIVGVFIAPLGAILGWF